MVEAKGEKGAHLVCVCLCLALSSSILQYLPVFTHQQTILRVFRIVTFVRS